MTQCGDYEDINFYVINEFYGIVIQRRSQGEVLRVLGPPLGPFMGPVPRGPGIA